jgi:6-phosphogluconolactonase
VAVLPVDVNGRLGEATCVVRDTGKGPNAKRQEGPHAHCVTMSPDNRFAFVCDLGIDKVMSYKFNAEHGKLTPNDFPFYSGKPGAGPRHLVFHPNEKFAYLINELDSTITTLAYDAKAGAFSELQSVSSLPSYYHGPNTAGEIGIAPSGKFLFASNRGSDSVELFAIDSEKGTLTLVESQKSGGKTPRHFGIQPSGENLVICNQNSHSIRLCRINPATSRLEPFELFAIAPSPSCAVFLPPIGSDKAKPSYAH